MTGFSHCLRFRRPAPIAALAAILLSFTGASADCADLDGDGRGDECAYLPGIALSIHSKSALVFDAGTDTVVGSVGVEGRGPGDCAITSDGLAGFVSSLDGELYKIDLGASPPRLAPGRNPIPLSNESNDVSLSYDEQFLLVCGNNFGGPGISIVSTSGFSELHYSIPAGPFHCYAIEACWDGWVYALSGSPNQIRRFTLDGNGILTDTGESLDPGTIGGPGHTDNLFCSPDPRQGPTFALKRAVPSYGHAAELLYFTSQGLQPLGRRELSGTTNIAILFGISGVVHPDGERVYARSTSNAVDVFLYDRATGLLSPGPVQTLTVGDAIPYYGLEQMALTPSGRKLYVTEFDRIRVFDALTGEPITDIEHPALDGANGICFPRTEVVSPPPQGVLLDIRPGSDQNVIRPGSPGLLPAAILSSPDFDASAVDPLSLDLAGAPVAITGAGAPMSSVVDVNADHLPDLRFLVRINLMMLSPGQTEASVQGRTFDGMLIRGTDVIRLVP